MPGERKSVEPIASVVAPSRVSAEHQSLLHFVGQSAWSDERLLAKVRELVAPAMETQGRIEAWIVDDTGFVKKGVHSVGVARQYCGRLGKTDNFRRMRSIRPCQVAVSLSIANHEASLVPGLDPGIAYRLYLPEEWANDAERRLKAHVPDEVTFRTKPEIALRQMKAALASGVARGVVLADAGYGSDGGFRAGVTAMGLTYAVGVQSTVTVWPAGKEPLPPKPWSGRGRKPSRVRRDGRSRLVSIAPKELLVDLGVSPGEDREGVFYMKNSCPSQGTMDIFVEPVLPRPRLLILGASPVAVELAKLAPRRPDFRASTYMATKMMAPVARRYRYGLALIWLSPFSIIVNVRALG